MELNIYRFGSHVYGTNHENSDEDFIIITDENKQISDNINKKYFTYIEFQRLLNNHDIQALECYFLPNHFKIKETYVDGFKFNLDNAKLRVSISTVTNGAWVKGKKKLTVMADYDKYLGIKSLFHSIRILGIGIQIATHGKIIDYSEYNWFLKDLLKLSEQYEHHELWDVIDSKYRSLYNKLNTEFKILCPKLLMPEHLLKNKVIKLFEDNNCYSQSVIDQKLISKIIKLFNEQ